MTKLSKAKVKELIEHGTEGKDYVKCRICGRVNTSKLSRHLKTHNLSSEQYLTQYPDAFVNIESPNQKDFAKRNMRKRWSEDREATQQAVQRGAKTRQRDESYQAKIKSILTERNKSSKMRQIVIERNQSPEMRELIRQRNLDPDFQMKAFSSKSAHPDIEVTDLAVGQWTEKGFETCNNSRYGNLGYYHSSKSGVTLYRSRVERDLMMALDKDPSVVEWKYEPFNVSNDSFYLIDFYVKSLDKSYLIEVKYNESPSKFKRKVDEALSYCEEHGHTFLFMRRKEVLHYSKTYQFISAQN